MKRRRAAGCILLAVATVLAASLRVWVLTHHPTYSEGELLLGYWGAWLFVIALTFVGAALALGGKR